MKISNGTPIANEKRRLEKVTSALFALAGLLFTFVAFVRFGHGGSPSNGFWLDLLPALLFLGLAIAYWSGLLRNRLS